MHLAELYEATDRASTDGPHVDLVHADLERAIDAQLRSNSRPDVVYIDPPFASARDYMLRLKSQDAAGNAQTTERVAYSDRWAGGHVEYLAFMRRSLEAVHRVLSDEGSLLLHCDMHASPYLALICDEIFGMGDRARRQSPGFRNELIWHYGLGGSSPRCYPKKHDVILWYTKGERWFFEPPRVPARSQRMAGQMKKMPDVFDIPSLNNMAKERCGYPTQKPLQLLELLLKAHTPPGGLVSDYFCGSGTSAVAAARLGLRAHASDQSDDAVAFTRERLLELEPRPRVRVFREHPAQLCVANDQGGIHGAKAHETWTRIEGNFDSANNLFYGAPSGEDVLIRDIRGTESITISASSEQ